MKDFRVPYKDSSQDHIPITLRKIPDLGNSSKPAPLSFYDFLQKFSKYIFVILVVGSYLLESLQNTQTRFSFSTNLSFDSTIEEFFSHLAKALVEMEANLNQKEMEPIADDSTATPVDGFDYTISEKTYHYENGDYTVYGILDNTSPETLRFKGITAQDKTNGKEYSGSFTSRLVLPGKKVPFLIRMKDWTGQTKLEFYADSERIQTTVLPVHYKMQKGKWVFEQDVWKFKTSFTLTSEESLPNAKLLLVLRDSDNLIYKLIPISLKDHVGEVYPFVPKSIEVPTDLETSPSKTDVYFLKN